MWISLWEIRYSNYAKYLENFFIIIFRGHLISVNILLRMWMTQNRYSTSSYVPYFVALGINPTQYEHNWTQTWNKEALVHMHYVVLKDENSIDHQSSHAQEMEMDPMPTNSYKPCCPHIQKNTDINMHNCQIWMKPYSRFFHICCDTCPLNVNLSFIFMCNHIHPKRVNSKYVFDHWGFQKLGYAYAWRFKNNLEPHVVLSFCRVM
jgi:hypothetical protein